MSMFWCANCAELRDSDDGCVERGNALVCVDCEADGLDEVAEQVRSAEGASQPHPNP